MEEEAKMSEKVQKDWIAESQKVFYYEYHSNAGEIYVEGGGDDAIGKAEGITVKVEINVKWLYNGSSIPSGYKAFARIEGNISKLTIYDAVLKSRLGQEKAEKIHECLHGHTVDGWRDLPTCEVHVEQLEDYVQKQSFGAIIKGVQFIIMIPCVSKYEENKSGHIKNYIIKNVNFVAKDIDRREAPSSLR
jgi:hypothetical protein